MDQVRIISLPINFITLDGWTITTAGNNYLRVWYMDYLRLLVRLSITFSALLFLTIIAEMIGKETIRINTAHMNAVM